MEAPVPGTLLSIARALGLSKVSVSVALRDKPGVSAAVRAKVKAEALRQGYQPDPISSEMMKVVRAKRRHDGTRTIAFINTFRDPSLLKRINGFREFVVGARAQAANLGYRLEVFAAHGKGMNSGRLADILYARGIRGVLIGPRWELEPPLEFPWERFASVMIGEPEYGPNLHRVSNHHAHTCLTALSRLADKGYRRIGLVLMKPFEKHVGYDHLLGAEQFKLSTDRPVKIITFLPEDWDEEQATVWARKEKIDAFVSLSLLPIVLLDRVRAPSGEKLGFASLSVFPGQPYSGIDQHTEDVGSAALDTLRELLISGERGTVPRPRVILLEGEWVEGETSPGPQSKVRRKKKRTESSSSWPRTSG